MRHRKHGFHIPDLPPTTPGHVYQELITPSSRYHLVEYSATYETWMAILNSGKVHIEPPGVLVSVWIPDSEMENFTHIGGENGPSITNRDFIEDAQATMESAKAIANGVVYSTKIAYTGGGYIWKGGTLFFKTIGTVGGWLQEHFSPEALNYIVTGTLSTFALLFVIHGRSRRNSLTLFSLVWDMSRLGAIGILTALSVAGGMNLGLSTQDPGVKEFLQMTHDFVRITFPAITTGRNIRDSAGNTPLQSDRLDIGNFDNDNGEIGGGNGLGGDFADNSGIGDDNGEVGGDFGDIQVPDDASSSSSTTMYSINVTPTGRVYHGFGNVNLDFIRMAHASHCPQIEQQHSQSASCHRTQFASCQQGPPQEVRTNDSDTVSDFFSHRNKGGQVCYKRMLCYDHPC